MASLDPTRHSLPHPQLHAPIPLPVHIIRPPPPPPPSSLPQPHFPNNVGGGRLLRSGITYPPPHPPPRAGSNNSINATSTFGRPITKRSSMQQVLVQNGLSNSSDNGHSPWWTSNNISPSPSQYNRAFPLLPTPTRRFSDNDWTVTVLSDDNTDMMPSNSDLDVDYRHRQQRQQYQRRYYNNSRRKK